jgi:hypothetical protein
MKRLSTGVAAVLLALTMTGCGNSSDGSAGDETGGTNSNTSESGGGDATAWADEVCSSMKDDIAALTTQPQLDVSNPQAAKDGLIGYFDTLVTSLGGMSDAVTDAGAPPVDGGEDLVKKFTDQIDAAKDAVTGAKTKIEQAPVNDPAAFQAAATAATGDLASLSDLEDPTAGFTANAELKAAYSEAASCKELQGDLSPTTS